MPVDYGETWSNFAGERKALVDKRTSLENELNQVRKEIAHLDEILSHLEPLAGLPWVVGLSNLGITDAIRSVVSNSKSSMSAKEVSEALAEGGFDFSGLTAPMASIYTVLGRLVDSGVVEREKDENNRVSFHWKTSEITDDDIPF